MAEKIALENAIVVTMNDEGAVHFDGTVVIEGDRILDVGPSEDVGRRQSARDARVIDAKGMAALPGLVDLHFHTALAKGWNDHLPLWEYLDTCWYPIIRSLDDEAAYWAALASYSESIRCGVTTVNDMYRCLPSLARAAEDIGIRAVLSNDIADAEHRLDGLNDARDAFEALQGKGRGRIEVHVGIEWLPLASPELLDGARALAEELGTGIHIHLNESLSEVEAVAGRFGGRRPTEVAFDHGLLGSRTVAAHCVWLSDREIALMRQTGTHVSHNPSSNAKLGNGVARVPDMVAAGLNIGLGHDAAECNNSRDMFEVMKYASLMHRAVRLDAGLLQAPEVLRMATRNGGAALGHRTGILAPGWKADLILVRLDNQMFTPLMPGSREQLLSHLVFAANGSCVDTTIIDGKPVMEHGRLTTVDEAEVLEQANRAFQRVVARIGA